MRRAVLAFALLATCAVAACKSEKEPPITVPLGTSTAAPQAVPASGASGTVIQYDPKSGSYKTNASKLKGDPHVCARFHACCKASSDTGLFCAMTETTEHTCGKALEKVKDYLKEKNTALPSGCH